MLMYRIISLTISPLLFGLVACDSKVSSEALIYVGRIEPVGMKFYVDKNSISRRADLSSIKAIVIPDPTKEHVETLQMAFDCADRTYSTSEALGTSVESPMVWVKGSERFSINSTAIQSIFNIACKKPYEVWR